jgi:hypothetical protein
MEFKKVAMIHDRIIDQEKPENSCALDETIIWESLTMNLICLRLHLCRFGCHSLQTISQVMATRFHWYPIGLEGGRQIAGVLYQVSWHQRPLNRSELK